MKLIKLFSAICSIPIKISGQLQFFRKTTGKNNFLIAPALVPALLIAFFLTAGSIVKAQTAPELSEAERFAILAGDSIISADSAFVKGDIGATTQIDSAIISDGGTFKDTACIVDSALSNLSRAKQEAAAQPATAAAPPTLKDTTLTSGVYQLSQLRIQDTLVLSGDSTSVFIFNVSDSLIFEAGSVIILDGVKAENVFWNVTGNVCIEDSASVCGTVMADGTICCHLDAQVISGQLLSTQSVTLEQAGTVDSRTQQIFTIADINLGAAASFAVLSGSDITAGDSLLLAVGNVGALGTVSETIFATDTLFASNDCRVQQAISDLHNAINIVIGIPATPIQQQLDGQSLTAGVYEINGNARLTGTLTLTGDTSSIYVFRIADTLNVDSGAILNLGSVLPHHIFWVTLNSHVSIGKNINFSGIIMTKGNIVSTAKNTGKLALLTAKGGISLLNNKFADPVYLFSGDAMLKMAQIGMDTVNTFYPDVEVCDTATFTLEIKIANDQFNDTLEINVSLPPGLQYLPNSGSSNAYTFSDLTTDPSMPSFIIVGEKQCVVSCPKSCPSPPCACSIFCGSTIFHSDTTITVTFQVTAVCGAPSNDTAAVVTQVIFTSGDSAFVSEFIKIKAPVININQSQMLPNSSIAGNVRDTICRFITISNDGNAPLFTGFTVTENYGPAIELVSITIDSAIYSVDTINHLITINVPADSLPPGGFMPGSKIVFQECFRIISCTDIDSLKNLGLSAFNYSWSCDTAVCQGGSTAANILVPVINKAGISVNASFINEDVCYGPGNSSEVSATITNSGSGPAFDFRLKLFGLSSLFMAIDTGQFKLDGIPVIPDSLAFGADPDFCLSPYISYAEFLMDIPPLTTRTLLFNTITCCPDTLAGCGDKVKFLPVQYSYHDQCAIDTDSVSVTNANFFYKEGKLGVVAWDGPEEMLDFAYDTIPFKAEDTSEFVFKILNFQPWPGDTTDMLMASFNLDGGLCYLDDSSIVITNNNTSWLPQNVVVDIDSGTCAGTVTAFFSLNNKPDTLSINGADIHIWFIAQCPAPGASTVDLSAFYVPSSSCSDTCAIPLSCDAQLITFVQCPGCDRSGIFTVDADFFRKNLGLPDNDNNGVADTGNTPDLTKINRDLLMVGDTLTGVVTSLVQNLTYPANPVFMYGYYEILIPGACSDSLAPSVASVTGSIYDVANDTTYIFQLDPPVLFDLGEYRYDFSIDTILQSGVPPTYNSFSHGDIITIMPEFVVTGNVGAKIWPCAPFRNHVYLGLAPIPKCDPGVCEPDTSIGGIIACNDTIPLCDSTVQYYCENAGGSFKLIGYDYSAQPGLAGVINCVQSISVGNTIRIGPFNDPNIPGNWFPFEYRNWGFNDTAKITMPPGFILDSVTFVANRSAGGIFVNQSVSRITPDIITVDSLGDTVITVFLQQYFSSDTVFAYQNDSLVYFADDDYAASIIAYMHPTCQTPEIINMLLTVYISYEPAFDSDGFNSNINYLFNYFPPVLSMQTLSSPVIDGVANTACWEVGVQNTGGNASNVWFASQSPSGNIQVNEMFVGNDTLISQNGIYQLGSIDFGGDKNVKICAQYSCDFALTADTLVLFLGWDCPVYPDSLQSALCPPDTFKLYLNPKQAELQHSVLMPDSVFICDTITVVHTIQNINAANVYDIRVTATLPAGTGYDSLSGFIQYPVTALPAPANPQINQDTLVWNLGNYLQYINDNGIPGSGFVGTIDSSNLSLTFNLLSSCSLLPANSIDIKVTGISNCGDTIALNFTKNLIIRDYPDPTEKTIAVSATNFSSCDSTATITVNIINIDTVTTDSLQLFILELPLCVGYNNAFTGIQNPPPDTAPQVSGDSLLWFLPAGVNPGDTIAFSFEAKVTDSACGAGVYSFNGIATVFDTTLFCAATGLQCAIDVPAGEDTAAAFLPVPLSFTLSSAPVSCTGGSNGTATVDTVAGGRPPYSFLWSNGDTIVAIDSLPADTFIVTVFDADSCFVVDTVIINEPPELIAIITDSADATCNGLCNGKATVNVTGGTLPYIYSWENGEANSAAIALCEGIDTVVVTDANGCKDTASAVINEPDSLIINFSTTDISCPGLCNGTATANVTGGTQPYNFSWSNGDTASTADSLCAFNTVIVTDTNGCSAFKFVTVSTLPQLVTSLSITKAQCEGVCNGSISANVSGGTPPYSYQWSTFPIQTTQTSSGLCSDTFTVVITDSNGCTDTAQGFVNNQQFINLFVTVIKNATCSGIDANGQLDIFFVSNPDSSDFQVTVLQEPGNNIVFFQQIFNTQIGLFDIFDLPASAYTIIILDVNSGCQMSIIDTIPGPPLLEVSSFTTTFASSCIDSDGTATAIVTGGTPPYAYLWSNGQATSTATGLAVGSYAVTVTDNNGCVSTAGAAIVSQFSVSTTKTDACGGGNNGAVTAIPLNGAAPFNYQWNDPKSQTTQSATGLAPGTYCVTVTDANPCSAAVCVTVQDTTTYTDTNGIVISSDTTWNGVHFRIDSGIRITNSAMLTVINSILEFSGNGIMFGADELGILVEAGSKLKLIHDTLTNIRGCNEMWDGIGVVGGKTVGGRLDMLAGSLLENAHTGVKNIRPGSDFPGIIFISNSTMKNNRRHVVIRALFAPPQSPWYSFSNAEFLCTGPLVDAATYHGEGTSEFMHLDFAPKNISIKGCTFKNIGPFAPLGGGTGIKSHNASYTVEPQGADTTRFINLHYGIYAEATNPLRTITARNNVFSATHRSILLRNMDFATVTGNLFHVFGSGGYGLYLDGCTGYMVEENSFSKTTAFPHGIVVNNSGNGGDEIYNNTFHDILNGIQPQGIASLNSNEGLQIKCNDFTNNIFQYHIAVTSGDIGDPQGLCLSLTDTNAINAPAGNTFTHECNFYNSDIGALSGTFFTYNHHSDSITTPICYDTVSVNPNDCKIFLDTLESCPSHLDITPVDPCFCCPKPCKISIDDQQLRIDSTQGVYDSLLDGGDTQAMLDTIATLHDGKVKEAILRISPFASDAVLLAAIAKNKPLSFGNIKEIILANSPVSNLVYFALINRNPSLPPGIIKEIDAAQFGVSPRDSLEGLIRFLLRQRSIAVNNLNRLYLNDTTINGIDSVITVLEQEQGDGRKMQLSSAYIANGDFVKARQLLDSLELIIGFDNFAAINKFIIDVFEDSAIFDTLLVDTTLRQIVEDIADDTLKFGYLTARAILSQVFGTIYPELIEELPQQQQLKWSGNEGEDTMYAQIDEADQVIKDYVQHPDDNSFVKLYPNPATNKITVEYLLPEKSKHGVIAFFNVLGIRNEYAVEGNYGKIDIDVTSWNSGVFYYNVIVNNNTIARNKIAIIKN